MPTYISQYMMDFVDPPQVHDNVAQCDTCGTFTGVDRVGERCSTEPVPCAGTIVRVTDWAKRLELIVAVRQREKAGWSSEKAVAASVEYTSRVGNKPNADCQSTAGYGIELTGGGAPTKKWDKDGKPEITAVTP